MNRRTLFKILGAGAAAPNLPAADVTRTCTEVYSAAELAQISAAHIRQFHRDCERAVRQAFDGWDPEK